MLLVRISNGQIGFLVGVFSQPIVKRAPPTMSSSGEVVQLPPQPGTLISGCVAVGDQFILAPIGEIRPIYEMPEEENNAKGEGADGPRTTGTGTTIDPAAATGDPSRGPEGEERSEA